MSTIEIEMSIWALKSHIQKLTKTINENNVNLAFLNGSIKELLKINASINRLTDAVKALQNNTVR